MTRALVAIYGSLICVLVVSVSVRSAPGTLFFLCFNDTGEMTLNEMSRDERKEDREEGGRERKRSLKRNCVRGTCDLDSGVGRLSETVSRRKSPLHSLQLAAAANPRAVAASSLRAD